MAGPQMQQVTNTRKLLIRAQVNQSRPLPPGCRRYHPPSVFHGGPTKRIIPREYGGTNEFNNLVPVLHVLHQQELNSWWMSYGG